MRSLQVRIALIIMASIAVVMVLASAATVLMFRAVDHNRALATIAGEIEQDLSSDPSKPAPPDQHGPPTSLPFGKRLIVDTPREGPRQPDLETELANGLKALSLTGDVRVTEDPGHDSMIVSYLFPDGKWRLYMFPRVPPPPTWFWLVLASWLGLVLAGIAGVALFMARRVTRPLVALEEAVTSVGNDGVLPHLPVTGSSEVRHVATVLNRLSDRLRASMESRMRLVAAAGHDLRTPMTRMRLRAEFLPEEERNAWTSDLDELELIAESAIRLVREEGANEDQKPISLPELIKSAASELVETDLPVTVGQLAPSHVKAGPLALRRALRNLIINAATHGGGAQVSAEVSEGRAHVIITDNGPGIAEELLQRVFEPFFRAEPGRTRTVKGAGLGLAISKDIIERFGGTISIANRPEGGLRQIVSLPEVSP